MVGVGGRSHLAGTAATVAAGIAVVLELVHKWILSSSALMRSVKLFGDRGDFFGGSLLRSATCLETQTLSVESLSLVVTSLPLESVLHSRKRFGGRGHGEKMFMGLVMALLLGDGIAA